MSKSGMEWKVGLFVLVGLVLAALMVMRFSKGTGLARTYELNLEARNAGGIIRGASVLMAGVPVGSITAIRLAADGSKVIMVAGIYEHYKIPRSAVFAIATVGVLGDRYVSVSPGFQDHGKPVSYLANGDTVQVQEAFDFATVAESAASLMSRLSGTLTQLSNVVTRLDRTLISDASLKNLTDTIENFRGLSERALAAVGNVDSFVETNMPALTESITNFAAFTEQLNRVTLELQETVITNRIEFTKAIKNIESATQRTDRILGEIEQGQGLAGALIRNEELANQASLMLSNFMVLSSNINHKGLWGVIRRPKIR